jgi:ATP-dependent protease ClpP protease subunit
MAAGALCSRAMLEVRRSHLRDDLVDPGVVTGSSAPTTTEAVRTVLIRGPIDRSVAQLVMGRLRMLDGSGSESLTLLIDSPGGRASELLRLLDVLDTVSCGVDSIVTGRALGTAAVLAAVVPGRREANPRAMVSLRIDWEAEVGEGPPALVGHLRLVVDRLARRLAGRTGRSETWLVDELRDGGLFRASTAVEWGLADGLVRRR